MSNKKSKAKKEEWTLDPTLGKETGEWTPGDPTLSQIQDVFRAVGMKAELKLIPARDVCKSCGRVIEMMIYKGTGVCSDNCRKAINGDDAPIGIF